MLQNECLTTVKHEITTTTNKPFIFHDNTTFNKTEQQNVQYLGKKLQRKKSSLLCLQEYAVNRNRLQAVNCNNFQFRIIISEIRRLFLHKVVFT